MSDADKPDELAVDDKQALDKAGVASLTKEEQEHSKAASEYSNTEANGELSMYVKVHSPFNDYYDGQAFSLSAENATGPFDILPKHHNFVSLLSPCEMIIRSVDKGEQRIRISGGIMHVKSDRIIIFLDV
ncbi:MAG: F0F1 ATP synthase subunit epsilon [Patescibacteria group bacterium]|nr:F0F1 ATP synthase subunit epsilon [Patescibacteria group bacterium]